jgi:hypothetical protein
MIRLFFPTHRIAKVLIHREAMEDERRCQLTDQNNSPQLDTIEPEQALAYLHQSLHTIVRVSEWVSGSGNSEGDTTLNQDSYRERFGALHELARGVASVIGESVNMGELDELDGRQFKNSSVTGWKEDMDTKMMISKRFWSKVVPEITVWDYLQRIHKYCPNSTAVYIASAVYIYRLCLILQIIPLTTLCVHRLVLAAIRIASKSLEDVTYLQKRFATAGGVSPADLYRLEIAFLFLLDFDIKVDSKIMDQCLIYIAQSSLVLRKLEAPEDQPA